MARTLWCTVCAQKHIPVMLHRDLRAFAKRHGLVLEDNPDVREHLKELVSYMEDANFSRRRNLDTAYCHKHALKPGDVLVA